MGIDFEDVCDQRGATCFDDYRGGRTVARETEQERTMKRLKALVKEA